jgi:hypothetical protein
LFSNKEEKLFVWHFKDNDLFMDLKDDICFRVTAVEYNKQVRRTEGNEGNWLYVCWLSPKM